MPLPSTNTSSVEGPGDGSLGDRMAGSQEELGVILLLSQATAGNEQGTDSEENDGCDG